MSLNRASPTGAISRLESLNFNIEPVATLLFPNKTIFHRTASEIRYGTQGSLSVNLDKNTFFDHERSSGGGTLELIKRECNFASRKEARDWYYQNIKTEHQPHIPNKMQENRRNIAEYVYTDFEGNPVLKVVRTEPKSFHQKYWDGKNWQTGGVKDPPLFNLPKIIETLKNNKPIAILEGEKDVLNAAKIGITATTKAGGVGKWNGEHLKLLKGGSFWVVPDNDVPGQKHAAELAQVLTQNGCTVKVICLPNLPDKGDISDWIESGGTKAQFVEIVKNTPVFEGVPPSCPKNKTPNNSECSIPQVCLTPFTEIKSQPINWLWKGYFAGGKLTLVAGQAGVGKTTCMLSIAAAVSRGGKFPDGLQSTPQNVILWSGEDDAADTLKPRLEAAGADMNKVFLLTKTDRGGTVPFNPAIDIKGLSEALEAIGGAGLIIIDPIVSMVSGDFHKATDVRHDLQPIVDLAAHHNCSVAGITHFSKNSQAKEASDRVLGSQAFVAVARIVILMGKAAEDDEGLCAFGRCKSNLCKKDGGFYYRIEDADGGGIEASCTTWCGPFDGAVADQLHSSIPSSCPTESGALVALREILADGPREYKDVQRIMGQGGFSHKQIRTAKERLDVTYERVRNQTFWSLPTGELKKFDALDALPLKRASGASNSENPVFDQILTDFNEEEGCL